jgi:hypothetical protein
MKDETSLLCQMNPVQGFILSLDQFLSFLFGLEKEYCSKVKN